MRLTKKTTNLLIIIIAIALIVPGCADVASTLGINISTGIIISEVVSSNSNSFVDPVYGRPDWIELTNVSDNPINLKDYSISDSRGGSNKYALPEITLNPGEYVLLFCCAAQENTPSDKYCTGFKLSKNGTFLYLSLSGAITQELDVPRLETDISYGLTKDGEYAYFSLPTPGAINNTEAYKTLEELESSKTVSLKINEVLPKNPSGEDPYAWVELYNAGKENIELSDYYLTDDLSNPTKGKLPEKILKPDEYIVLKLNGGTGDNELPFKINSRENYIALSNNFGVKIADLTWDVSVFPGISAGLSDNDAAKYFNTPTPGAKNGSDCLTDTDFTINEGAADIRINELLIKNTFSLIDEDGDRSPWVELYNSSGSEVSLKGYSLSDDKDDLWKWSFPDVKMAAGSYSIVYLSGKNRKTENPFHTSFRLGNSDDCIALTCIGSRTKQIITLPKEKKDNVSYGISENGQWMYYPEPTPLDSNHTKGFTAIAEIGAGDMSGVKINEVMAVTKARSNKPDWVEIKNELTKEVNLSGYYLSDTDRDLKKWPISGVKIPAGGYAVIDKYKKGNETNYITISLSGERIYLSNPSGVLVDEYDTGVLRPSITSGLGPDGSGSRFFYASATPGKKNSGNTIDGYCASPVFSENGGYKTSGFSLEMQTATKDGKIYYTLDGSTPTSKSKLYEDPVSVSSTKTVRAVTISEGRLQSEETVATFLFEKKHSLPVVCLSMTASDLKYVFNSPDRDVDHERAGYVEYYENDGKLGVRFPAGFRIGGFGTRLYAQRTINLFLRGGYGKSSVTYPFFEDYPITTFQSLTLRNMGQDKNKSCLRDAYVGMIVKGMNIDYMEAKFCAVYINGKYWGLYEFKENQNKDYFASRHGIDPEKMEIIRSNTRAVKGTNKDIKSMFSAAGGNMANANVFAKFTARADADYFMDYLIALSFACSTDAYNQKYVRTIDNKLKWRPIWYDLDLAMSGSVKRQILRRFFQSGGIGLGKPDSMGMQHRARTELFYAFYKNREWRKQFVIRYAEVLNTVLTTEKMLDRLDKMVDSIKDEIPRHIKRWGGPSSVSKWNNEVKALRRFVSERRKYAIQELRSSLFDISDSELKKLLPNDF